MGFDACILEFLFLCMYVYACVYVYICTCILTHDHAHTAIHAHTHTHTAQHTHTRMHVHTHKHAHTHTHTHTKWTWCRVSGMIARLKKIYTHTGLKIMRVFQLGSIEGLKFSSINAFKDMWMRVLLPLRTVSVWTGVVWWVFGLGKQICTFFHPSRSYHARSVCIFVPLGVWCNPWVGVVDNYRRARWFRMENLTGLTFVSS